MHQPWQPWLGTDFLTPSKPLGRPSNPHRSWVLTAGYKAGPSPLDLHSYSVARLASGA